MNTAKQKRGANGEKQKAEMRKAETRTAVTAVANSQPPAPNIERGPDETHATKGTDAEPYIGKAEVARRLGRTVRTVDKLMNKGRIPFYKFDWRVAFRWSEVQAHFSETCRVCRRNEVKR